MSALLFLNKQFKKVFIKDQPKKLDELDKPKDQKPNPTIEKVKKSQPIKKMLLAKAEMTLMKPILPNRQ